MNCDTDFIMNQNGQQNRIPLSVLKEFSESIGMDCCIEGRYSSLFAFDLFRDKEKRKINPLQVMDEVRSLENADELSQTKQAIRFKNLPLRGLWHKHYFTARFMVKNIENSFSGNKLTELIDQTLVRENVDCGVYQRVYELSDKIVRQSYEEKARLKRLTGEWIIFAKYNDENYYLSMGVHKMDDKLIYERIKENCFCQFPFLKSMMNQ